MNVLVIEEEKLKVQKIRDLLFEIDDSITVVGVIDDMPSAARWLQQHKAPDLILANKEMMKEVITADNREIKALVTISTTKEEYNFEAFRYRHLRYIINNMPETGQGVEDLRLQGEQVEKLPGAPSFKERFLVKHGQRLLSIPIEDIAYFFSDDRFIFLKTFDNQKFPVEYRIEQLENLLAPTAFFRVNRSFIISLATVKEIHAYFGNRLKLYLSPATDKEVIVSRKRVNDFKQWLGK